MTSDKEFVFVTWWMRRRLKNEKNTTGFSIASTKVANLQPQKWTKTVRAAGVYPKGDCTPFKESFIL